MICGLFQKVQNRKLSECLRERNRGREQLEQRIKIFEQSREDHLRYTNNDRCYSNHACIIYCIKYIDSKLP